MSTSGDYVPDFWREGEVSEDQIGLFPEPESAPEEPTPTPIADAAAEAVSKGWIPADYCSALYVSAGSDTKAPVYLGPGRLDELGLAGMKAPDFFVYTDKDWVGSDSDHGLSYRDDQTRVETTEVVAFEGLAVPGYLLRLRVTSDRFEERQVAILRLKIENEKFAKAGMDEKWSPEWFVGICDGCAGFGGNYRCENDLEDLAASVPLRLGARFWVTDHFNRNDTRLPPSSEDGAGFSIELAAGSHLRQRAFISNHWTSSNSNNGSRIFEVDLEGPDADPR